MTTEVKEVPAEVTGWVGQTRYEETANFPVERGYIWSSCASVENGNPLFWEDAVATELTGGPVAPPTTLSLWFRPHSWEPGQPTQRLPLQIHFDLKERLGLPEAVMTDSEVVFHEPVRPGDVITTRQVLRSVSEPKTTKLGTGRFWVIDVEYVNQHGDLVGVEVFTGFGYQRAAARPASGASDGAPAEERPTTACVAGERRQHSVDLPPLTYDVTATTVVLGAIATRDWRPMHHDKDFAVNRNGTKDIFLNTPNQQAWFERYVTDWTGPKGRLGRMRFRMRDSVFPGDTMTITGVVDDVTTDDVGSGWATVSIELKVGERICTTCTARVALPVDDDDNPWRRRGADWKP